MKTIKVMLLAAFLILPISSQAAKGGKPPSEACDTDWSACSVSIYSVRTAIEDAEYMGRHAVSSESNLIVKLDSAEAKLTCGKVSDAVAKLEEISNKATDLASIPSPKTKLDSAADINAAVSAAIVCLVPPTL